MSLQPVDVPALALDESVFDAKDPCALHLVPMSRPANALDFAAAQLADPKRLLDEKFKKQKAAIDFAYRHHTQRKKYTALLEIQQREEAERFEAVEEQLAGLAKAAATAANTPVSSKAMTPGGTGNTLQLSRRYFRVLVWNLENFTSDSRPRGSEPIAFKRNQARIAAVVATMKKFRIDLLLAMETGSDVGEAMTGIASALGEAWHPLVSVPTGARPDVRSNYDITLERPTARRALALNTLSSIYVIKPRTPFPSFSDEQVNDALALLPDVAGPVRELGESYTTLIPDAYETARENDESAGVAIPKLINVALEELKKVHLDAEGLLGAELEAAQHRAEARDQAVVAIGAKAANGDFSGAISEAATYATAVAKPQGGDARGHRAAHGWLHVLELLLRFALKLEQNPLLATEPLGLGAPGAGTVFFCTGFQKVTLEARNPGNVIGNADEDVMFNALLRIGAENFHYETYGMVYKPPYGQALDDLFKTAAWTFGVTDDPFPRAYDIVKCTRDGKLVTIQTRELNWRSALEVAIPIGPKVTLPLALYHTRYSGSEFISMMDPRFIAAENTILARCVSVAEVARWAVSYWPERQLPFIVGDFNLPTDVIEGPEPASSVKGARMQVLHEELTHGMAALGYVRHADAGGKHPRTTLVSYATLALGQKRYSESYDGVYEPVTWAGSGMRSRSGAILLEGVVDGELLRTEIKVSKAPSVEQEVDVDDDDDDAVNQSLDTSVDAETPAETEDVPAGVVFADYTVRAYRAMLRKVWKALEKREAWLSTRRTQPPFQSIWAVYKDGFAAHLAERTDWFREGCLDARVEPYKKLPARPEPLEEWRDLLLAAESSANDYDKPVLTNLKNVVIEVLAQLTGIETNLDARTAIAYRAVVSDHLPILLEIDMNPV